MWDETTQQHYLNDINGAIGFAEYLSGFICEECGSPGSEKRAGAGWITTLCDECHGKIKREEVRAEIEWAKKHKDLKKFIK